MSGTFLCPYTCGFARVVAFELSKEVTNTLTKNQDEAKSKFHSRILQEQYKQFKSFFNDTGECFDIDYYKYMKKLPSLKNAINNWDHAKKNVDKAKYLDVFSWASWNKLSQARRKEHTFSNCRGCRVQYAGVQALFPIRSPRFKSKALENPVSAALNEASRLKHDNALKPSNRDMKNTVQILYEKVSPTFEKVYNVTLAEALSKLPNVDMTTKSQKRQDRRQHYRKTKQSIENQMSETACLRCYGSGQSLRGWQRSRIALSFETKDALIAQCGSSESEQLLYSKTRLECIGETADNLAPRMSCKLPFQ